MVTWTLQNEWSTMSEAKCTKHFNNSLSLRINENIWRHWTGPNHNNLLNDPNQKKKYHYHVRKGIYDVSNQVDLYAKGCKLLARTLIESGSTRLFNLTQENVCMKVNWTSLLLVKLEDPSNWRMNALSHFSTWSSHAACKCPKH